MQAGRHKQYDTLQRVGSNANYRRKAVSRRHSRREVSWKELTLCESVEGLKGEQYQMVCQKVAVKAVQCFVPLVCKGHHVRSKNSPCPVCRIWDVLPTSPAYSPSTRSVRSVGWEGASGMRLPIPLDYFQNSHHLLHSGASGSYVRSYVDRQ